MQIQRWINQSISPWKTYLIHPLQIPGCDPSTWSRMCWRSPDRGVAPATVRRLPTSTAWTSGGSAGCWENRDKWGRWTTSTVALQLKQLVWQSHRCSASENRVINLAQACVSTAEIRHLAAHLVAFLTCLPFNGLIYDLSLHFKTNGRELLQSQNDTVSNCDR